jgi:glycosyltransferase involved in cell wall biosynthesis
MKRCLLNYPACDIVHLFQPFPSAALPWMWPLRKGPSILFYDWDDLYRGGLMNGKSKLFRDWWIKSWVNYLEHRLPKRSNHVTTCSQFLARLATERRAPGVSVIPNGFWPYIIPDKKAARESLGLDPQAIYVGFMGSGISFTELSWCCQALEMCLQQYKNLRFAICGPQAEILQGLSTDILRRIDFLGSLPTPKTRDFAAAIDLGLLPLEDSPFNQSRFPIKYAEYMAAGTPVLCSEIGECAQLSTNHPWVIKAGKTKAQWLNSFKQAVALLFSGQITQVDRNVIEQSLSWNVISSRLLNIYLSEMRLSQSSHRAREN